MDRYSIQWDRRIARVPDWVSELGASFTLGSTLDPGLLEGEKIVRELLAFIVPHGGRLLSDASFVEALNACRRLIRCTCALRERGTDPLVIVFDGSGITVRARRPDALSAGKPHRSPRVFCCNPQRLSSLSDLTPDGVRVVPLDFARCHAQVEMYWLT